MTNIMWPANLATANSDNTVAFFVLFNQMQTCLKQQNFALNGVPTGFELTELKK